MNVTLGLLQAVGVGIAAIVVVILVIFVASIVIQRHQGRQGVRAGCDL